MSATTRLERRAAAAIGRQAKGLLVAYWRRRLSEGATTTEVVREVGLPYTTFRRWAGSDPAPYIPVSQRRRYVEAFVPVEVGSRQLVFGTEPSQPPSDPLRSKDALEVLKSRFEGDRTQAPEETR